MASPYRIAVLGLWHLGEVYSVGLSELGHTVIGIASDEQLIGNFKKKIPPLPEPQLEALLQKHQSTGQLSYTTDWSEVAKANVVWIAFDVDVNDADDVDLAPLWQALEKSIPHLAPGAVLAVSSQIPAGTSGEIINRIKALRPDLVFDFFYSPENLRLGNAIEGFMNPGRIVVGADTSQALTHAQNIFAPLKAQIISMKIASAEMTKHALNAWLATSISFTNDLADACESVGADVEDVIKALKAEPRIGPKAYLFAGLGFSGGTLGRDLKALIALAKKSNLNLPMIVGAYEKNRTRASVVKNRLLKEWGSLKEKRIAIFGITYKPGTPTLRRSQPLEIEFELRDSGADIRLYDPLALAEEVAPKTPSLLFKDPYEAAQDSELVLVLSPDPKFQELDFKKLAAAMKTPVLFDAQNILVSKEAEIRSAGIKYLSIGR